MSRMTLDGTAESVSRDQILKREREQENTVFIFSVQLTTSRIGNLTRSTHPLLHTYYSVDPMELGNCTLDSDSPILLPNPKPYI